MANSEATSKHIKALLPEFEKYYEGLLPEPLIKNAQSAFRKFWNDKIMNEGISKLEEIDDLDPIIRLLDSNGKRRYEYENEERRMKLLTRLMNSGRQYGLEYKIEEDQRNKRLQISAYFGASKCMITQKDWYLIFNDLKADQELRRKLDILLKEKDPTKRISEVDELREINSRHDNKLTTPQAVPLNAILHCYDPYVYTSIVSLSHRRLIIETFVLGNYPEKGSYGEQVILSNELLRKFNVKFGVEYDITKLSTSSILRKSKIFGEPKDRPNL